MDRRLIAGDGDWFVSTMHQSWITWHDGQYGIVSHSESPYTDGYFVMHILATTHRVPREFRPFGDSPYKESDWLLLEYPKTIGGTTAITLP